MRIGDYYKNILVPANSAVSAIRRAGIPMSKNRLAQTFKAFKKEVEALKTQIAESASRFGIDMTFSIADRPSDTALRKYLYGKKGLNLECTVLTEKTSQPSVGSEVLREYACLVNPRDDDLQEVRDILKLKSLTRAISTNIIPFYAAIKSDGCIHPQFNWAVVRTSRISASDPPVHQIPEKSDKEVAKALKSCIVPRIKPADKETWNPKIHGSVFRWDISGAEMAVRAAMLTKLLCKTSNNTLWDYIRNGKDIHARTAAVLYGVPEGTFTKGDYERDAVGKQTNFALLYGGSSYTLKSTLWNRARIRIDDEEAELRHSRFFEGYPELSELMELDKALLGKNHYCEDGYGRRRWIDYPESARFIGFRGGRAIWNVAFEDRRALDHAFHTCANTPTQSMSATDNLWMLALMYHGEYVPLSAAPMWGGRSGVLFPEAANWRFHEGPGPNGKPFLAWHTNTVHDSGWGDCAPGFLEPVMKVIARRCTAIPFDWRLTADVPYRIDLQVGPDMGNLMDYNEASKIFGLEPMPVR